MTPERVETLIESYGADPSRWPADERGAATAQLTNDATLAAALREDLKLARNLDATLHSLDVPMLDARATARLIARVIAVADSPPRRITHGRWRTRVVGPTLAAAASLLLGFGLGSGAMTNSLDGPLDSSLDTALVASGNDDDSATAMEVSMAAFTTAASTASAEVMLGGAAHQATAAASVTTGGGSP